MGSTKSKDIKSLTRIAVEKLITVTARILQKGQRDGDHGR